MASVEMAPPRNSGPRRDVQRTMKPSGLTKPDERKHQEIIDKSDKRIADLRSQIDRLRRDLDDKQGGRDEFNKAKNEFRGQLDELVVKINALEAERKGIEAKLNESRAKSQEAKQGAQRLRKSLGYSTVEEIDHRIAQLENEMMVSSYNLKEEKKVMQEIAQLKQNRPLLARTMAVNGAVEPGQNLLPLKTQLQDITKQLDILYEQKKGTMGKRSKMMQERSVAQGPVKELADQRMSLARELQEEEKNRRLEFDRFKKETREHEQKEQEHRRAHSAKLREGKARIVVSKKIEEVQKHIDSVEDFPFESDVTSLVQMKKYINRLYSEAEGPDVSSGDTTRPGTGSSNNDSPQAQQQLEGALIPKKKQETFFYAPKEKKDKKKSQGNKDHKGQKPRLIFDIDTLAMFKQYTLDTPTTAQDFPVCIKQIDTKLEEYAEEKTKYEATVHGRRLELKKQLDELNANLAKLVANSEKEEKDKALEKEKEKEKEKVDPISE